MEDNTEHFGQTPVNEDASLAGVSKRFKPYRNLLADTLPCADKYEVSYMHRDVVSHVVVARQSEFIITGSVDGHIKFWRKMQNSIEFVKHFQAHLGLIHAVVVSSDDRRLLTTSVDQTIKIFDILIFDMASMIDVDYTPTAAVWLSPSKIAVADLETSAIRVYRTEGSDSNMCVQVLYDIHAHPVTCMELNPTYGCVVSGDRKGVLEYWDIASYQPLSSSNSTFVLYEFKSETDLYELAKHKTEPISIKCSGSGQMVLITSKDRHIRLFDFRSAKLKRKYDESVKVYATMVNESSEKTELLDTVRRKLDIETELGDHWNSATSQVSALFDETGKFILYSCLVGVKIVDIDSNVVIKVLGKADAEERFLAIALYQGCPKVDMQFLLTQGKQHSRTTAEQMHADAISPDPTVFACSFKKHRFYCLSRREPNAEPLAERDRWNEAPSANDIRIAQEKERKKAIASFPKQAILRTSYGDIHIQLFVDDCPRTIENFVTHCRNGYYDGVKFHRVIKGFMIQTGDPLGDGTGGESIWGGDFEDEFRSHLKHDVPYTVSMANAGPNTNGSQFFITVVPTPHLNGKHTVFGRLTSGFDVVHRIEGVKVDKFDAPLSAVKILSVDLVHSEEQEE